MKLLTRAEKGVVIELNLDEFQSFSRLVDSVEGKTLDETYFRDFSAKPWIQSELDLASVFGVIEAFYLSKFRINEIQRLINLMNSALEKNEKLGTD